MYEEKKRKIFFFMHKDFFFLIKNFQYFYLLKDVLNKLIKNIFYY